MNLQGCEDVPSWINDGFSSIDTHGSCISICELQSCQGICVKMSPGSEGHHDLGRVRMDRTVTSAKPC